MDFGVTFLTSDFACHLAESLFLTLGFACALLHNRHISYVGLRTTYGLIHVPCVGARSAFLKPTVRPEVFLPRTGIEPVSPPSTTRPRVLPIESGEKVIYKVFEVYVICPVEIVLEIQISKMSNHRPLTHRSTSSQPFQPLLSPREETCSILSHRDTLH